MLAPRTPSAPTTRPSGPRSLLAARPGAQRAAPAAVVAARRASSLGDGDASKLLAALAPLGLEAPSPTFLKRAAAATHDKPAPAISAGAAGLVKEYGLENARKMVQREPKVGGEGVQAGGGRRALLASALKTVQPTLPPSRLKDP